MLNLSSNSVIFGAAFGSAFLITLFFGKVFIPILKSWQRHGQPIRTDGLEAHINEKKGTPTMGGLIFIPAILITSIIFMDRGNLISWLPLIGLVSFGLMGLVDDYNKVVRGNAYAGLTKWGRLAFAGLVSVVLTFLIDSTIPAYIPNLSIVLPAGIILSAGIWYFIWSYFVITGTANAVNLADGQDGLASKLFLIPMFVMVIALVGITRVNFMPNLVFLPETAALFPVFGATIGAVLGFLWFNAKPASIFMGDVGALALGGFLGTSALIMKMEIIMAIASFMMVIILITSAMQMTYYKFPKIAKKAPFLMAPLHNHFQKKGIPETKITERFFILSIIFAGLAIGVLKL